MPLPKEDLKTMSRKTFSTETNKKIRWVVRMFDDWRNFRNSQPNLENIQFDFNDESTISREALVFAMCRFLIEVKKLDGSDFPGRTLYDITVCMQFKLETLGYHWKLLNEECLKDIRFTLDNVMKLRTSQGVGTTVKQAQVLNNFDEELLWNLGLLGTSTPSILLNTVVFLIGKGCVLRAGKEHRSLRSPPFDSQFKFIRNNSGETVLRYSEEIGSKTNKGGLKHRKVEPKVVDVYAIEDKLRCPLTIISTYLDRLPVQRTCKAFYLQPRKKFRPGMWYLDKPVSENKLRDVIKDICESAGLPGFYTNHSLRSTSATTMYQGDIDEQIIQEITGHRSLAVRSYKRTCDKQRKEASNCIFNTQK